ncbi:20044_t:CDS:1, partial [Funneliformis geosporum]
MRVENIEQIYHISVPNQQNKPKQPIQFMDLDKPIPIKQSQLTPSNHSNSNETPLLSRDSIIELQDQKITSLQENFN